MNGYDILQTIIYIITLLIFGFVIYYTYKKYKQSKEDYKINTYWIAIFIFLGIGTLFILFR